MTGLSRSVFVVVAVVAAVVAAAVVAVVVAVVFMVSFDHSSFLLYQFFLGSCFCCYVQHDMAKLMKTDPVGPKRDGNNDDCNNPNTSSSNNNQ